MIIRSEECAETPAEAAERIRGECPIVGPTATDDECRVRCELVDAALDKLGVAAGRREWHSAQMADGRVVGIWAHSVQEAEINLTVWWSRRCFWVIADPDCRVRDEYFPRGKRNAVDAAHCFPLTAPRRARDQFAPTQSLLDLLGAEVREGRHV